MRRILGGSVAATLAVVAGAASPLRAQMDMQHPMEMHAGPLGIPETRMGSGTSWLPDASALHAAHYRLGRWTLMLHGKGFLQYDWQGGSRGSNQLGLVNWAMAAASRPLGGGQLQLRAMLSAEPWTIGSRGYPLLVQTGESYQGAPLHDRRHPHDLFMELSALYERPVARNLGLSLYLAPVGEPAVGPVASQFIDAVAVSMITPGPVVITVAFIGYLVAGLPGAILAAIGVFLPVYLVTVLLAPHFHRVAKNRQVKAFVDGVTAAATGAIAGAAVILGRRALLDLPTILIALVTAALLLAPRKIPEPLLIVAAGLVGLMLKGAAPSVS